MKQFMKSTHENTIIKLFVP